MTALLSNVAKNHAHIGLFEMNPINKALATSGRTPTTAFTPFPDCSPNDNKRVSNVAATAQLAKEAIITADTPLARAKNLQSRL
jgi:hypothetical protein